jgi:hypothetical protein
VADGGGAPFRCKVDCGGGGVSSLAEQGDEDLFALFLFLPGDEGWSTAQTYVFLIVKASYKLNKSYQLF